jgi:hypothetical protein
LANTLFEQAPSQILSVLTTSDIWFHSYSLTHRTGMYYFNIVNG